MNNDVRETGVLPQRVQQRLLLLGAQVEGRCRAGVERRAGRVPQHRLVARALRARRPRPAARDGMPQLATCDVIGQDHVVNYIESKKLPSHWQQFCQWTFSSLALGQFLQLLSGETTAEWLGGAQRKLLAGHLPTEQQWPVQ